MKIEHIEKAKAALREAIMETTGPVVWPHNDAALDKAVRAIIEATVKELIIEWRTGGAQS